MLKKKLFSVILVLAVVALSVPTVSAENPEIVSQISVSVQRVKDTIELIVSFPPVDGLEGYSIKVGFDNSVVSIDELNGYRAPDWKVDCGIGGISGDNLVIDAGMYSDSISTSTQRQVSEFVFNIIDNEAPSAVFTVYLSDYRDSAIKIENCNYIIGTYEIDNLAVNAEDFLEYKNNEDETGIIITAYDPSISGSFEIPSEIDGLPVTGIEDYAFSDCTSLTGITIPNSVTSIGCGAFSGCTSLTAINVGADNENYSSIDGVLFNKNATELIYCPEGKSGSYTIPDGVTSVGDEAFCDCILLTGITIPDGVTSIGDLAFNCCTSLTDIAIPDSVTHIGAYAFSDTGYYYDEDNWQDDVLYIGNHLIEAAIYESEDYSIKQGTLCVADCAFWCCDSLTVIVIPDSVTSIGDGAFSCCTSLTAINVDVNNQNYCSIDGVLFNKDITELICCPAGKSGSYSIPGSVTGIGEYAFEYCGLLTDITIPDGVTSIKDGAFFGCEALTDITIPEGITNIGCETFSGCISLENITLPKSLKNIDYDAFSGCEMLTGILIPVGVTSIGSCAFQYCSELSTVTVPKSVINIGFGAFADCTSLTGITIPNSVTDIGLYAFYDCELLTIYCYEGSAAEQYAVFNGIEYETIDDTELEIAFDSELVINTGLDTVTANTAKMTASSFAAQFLNINVAVYDKNGTLLGDDDYVGTGCEVRLMSGGETVDSLTVIVTGDVDGNGLVDVTDARTVLRVAVELENFDDNPAAVYAADVTGTDGKTDVNDARKILRVAVGLENF